MWAVIGAVAGLAVGVLVTWLIMRREIDKRIATVEGEWGKRWRFEEARLMARVKIAEDQREEVAAGRDAAWWKWLEALAAGKIPLAEAMRNAPAPRPASRNLQSSGREGGGVSVEFDDAARASK